MDPTPNGSAWRFSPLGYAGTAFALALAMLLALPGDAQAATPPVPTI